jgi:diguanylate cyclase (GGDEF)-like protein
MHEIRVNEEIEKKLQEIETKILSIVNYRDFFDVLLFEIKHKFKISYAWISLIDDNQISTLIQTCTASDDLENQMTGIDRGTFLRLVGTTSTPLFVNDDLKPYYGLFPPDSSYFIKSLAIAPISLDNTVIGSLNLADFSDTHFHQKEDKQFLELLAIKVSISLSNVTAHEKLRSFTFHDPHTGLLNRNVVETILEREFTRDQRYENELSVILLDLDNFEPAMDTFGHDSGETLLRHVADKLVEMSRSSDVISRVAGGKFMIVLPETNAENALHLIHRLQSYYKDRPLQIRGQTIPVSMSFGVASTEDRSIKNAATLLKRADEMLIFAKNSRAKNSMQGIRGKNMSKVIQLPVAKRDRD